MLGVVGLELQAGPFEVWIAQHILHRGLQRGHYDSLVVATVHACELSRMVSPTHTYALCQYHCLCCVRCIAGLAGSGWLAT